MSTSEGKSKGGRPIALTEQQLKIFSEIVDKYQYVTDEELFFMFQLECEKHEIKALSYRTFQEYKANPDSYKNNPNYEIVKLFSRLIKKTQVNQKNELIEDIKKGEQGWQAKAWITERKFSENWSAVSKVKQENVNYNTEITKEEAKAINKALEDEY